MTGTSAPAPGRSTHRAARHTPAPSSSVAGLGTALRIAWRRSRLFWVLWVLALVSVMPATVSKYHDLVPSGTDPRTALDALAANPTMRALLGPPFDLMTAGGFTMWRVGTFTAAAAAMMAGVGVIRATRAEEEVGRTELLRAGALGRHAPLAAGVILGVIGCAVTGLLIAAALASSTPLAGSLATGAGIALTGTMWVGLGAVCAQVFESARAARVWTLGAGLGGLYLLRAMADASAVTSPESSWVSAVQWADPLEWAALARPYAGERWWVLLLPLAVTIALLALAVRLESARDYGSGLRQTTLGPPHAAPSLRDADGLAWRLQRTGVLWWSVGILACAVGMGSLGATMDSFTSGDTSVADLMRKMGGAHDLTTAFYSAMLEILVVVIALAAVVILGRLRSEEVDGHVELMLATATSRTRMLLSHLGIALLLPSILLIATGALLPVLQCASLGDYSMVVTFAKAAAALLPGLWLVTGIAAVLLGWAPRLYPLSWVVLGWCMFVSWLAPLFDLPSAMLQAQPWGHLPHLPMDAMAWTPVLAETLLAAVLLALAWVGYRRRAIPS